MRLKCAINESTRASQKRKPTPPRCARQPLPGEGARVDTPSFLWKEVPRRGGGWMGIAALKTSRKNRLKCAIIREHPSAAEKGSQPRLAALGSLFQGKGLAWTHPPSHGRRCPEGAEVGWGKRDEKERKIVSGRRFTKAPSARKQLIKPIYSYKKRKSNAANDFNVICRSGYRLMQEKAGAVHFYD